MRKEVAVLINVAAFGGAIVPVAIGQPNPCDLPVTESVKRHASDGAADEVTVEDLATSAGINSVFMSDGAGGIVGKSDSCRIFTGSYTGDGATSKVITCPGAGSFLRWADSNPAGGGRPFRAFRPTVANLGRGGIDPL